MRRNSSCSTVRCSSAASASIVARAGRSSSSFDSPNSSVLSARWLERWSIVSTTVSSDFFSRPSSCARFGSFQTFGFSSAALTSFSRSDLRS
jgi:hypothetical protein